MIKFRELALKIKYGAGETDFIHFYSDRSMFAEDAYGNSVGTAAMSTEQMTELRDFLTSLLEEEGEENGSKSGTSQGNSAVQ